MKRVVRLEGEIGQRRFVILSQAFFGVEAKARSLEQLRREAAVAKKLEALRESEQAPLKLKEGGGELLLEQPELDLLLAVLPQIAWLPAAAGMVVDAEDALRAAEQVSD